MADGPQVVILAAGLGTRMRSSTPKVLHEIGGRPMISHVLDVAAAVSEQKPMVVVNPEHDSLLKAIASHADYVEQPQPRGTGDAVRSVPAPRRTSGPVVVLSADVPLLRAETVAKLVAAHAEHRAAATLLTLRGAVGNGLGHVIRDADGSVRRIVEERDAEHLTEGFAELNAGVYVFDGSRLWPALERLSTENSQGEYYLTDVVELLTPDVHAVAAGDPTEAIGVNDRRQLAEAEAVLRRRTLDRLMELGVTIEDPATTYIDTRVEVGADSVIKPMTSLRGSTRLGPRAEIGPGAQLRDVQAGEGVRIGPAYLEECELGDGVEVGPFCRVRPNTVLRSGVHLGTHAEVKNSTVGAGTHINHFACVLDSDVGSDVNVGAGTVTCNFDGSAKHRTTVADGVFIGSNSTLVAPLRLGAGCYVAAGSVVTTDVPPGALAMGRARQRNIEGWVARRAKRS